jgi:hypothetical protein
MTKGQAATLRSVAIGAYRPKLFEKNFSSEEAAKRLGALKQAITLAESF